MWFGWWEQKWAGTLDSPHPAPCGGWLEPSMKWALVCRIHGGSKGYWMRPQVRSVIR